MTGPDRPLLQVQDLVAGYGGLPVLKRVCLHVAAGEVVGIVGESGSGKTTLGRALLRLAPTLSGSIRFGGIDITALSQRQMRPLRRRMQMIFQDPMAALNPRHTVGRTLTAPLLLHHPQMTRRDAASRAAAIADRVGLPAAALQRYPHELSGGQRQRVGIARALLLRPDFVLADEIVSGLDVSTQAQVLQLLGELGREMGLALAFISHDLSVVRAICHRVVVLRRGEIVEQGACEDLFANPQSAYTRALIDAIPLPVPNPNWLAVTPAGLEFSSSNSH